MSSSVLILATRYDDATLYSYEWAEALHKELLSARHQCIFLNPEGVCRSGGALADAVGRSEFVVFYGHGEINSWIALPPLTTSMPGLANANAVDLVNIATLQVLDGRKVYAGCCHSLSQLGQSYTGQYPASEFIGYKSAFGFEFENHTLFRDVVNASVVKFISGAPKSTIKNQLVHDWDMLRHDFMNGKYSTNPNAFAAGQWADKNKQAIDCC